MTVEELKEKLREGIVQFEYTKKDGSIRTAKGTLNLDLIKKFGAEPKGTQTEISDAVIRYYDINSEGWRSFIKENLV